MGSLLVTENARRSLLRLLERAGTPDPVVQLGLQLDAIYVGNPEEVREAALSSIAHCEWRLVPHVFERKRLGHLRAIDCDGISLAFPAGPYRLMFGVYLGEHYVVDVVDSRFALLNSKGAVVLPKPKRITTSSAKAS